MIKNKQFLVAVLAGAAALWTLSTPVEAAVFSDFVDFGGAGFGSTGSIEVTDSSGFSWLHDINDDLLGNAIGDVVLTDATLRISYGQVNGSASSELWLIVGDSISLGSLTGTANANEILTVPFALTSEALALLQADGKFSVVPTETTNGADKFLLFESTLSGNYTVSETQPVVLDVANAIIPEPTSFGLLGLGLLGAVRRRRKAA